MKNNTSDKNQDLSRIKTETKANNNKRDSTPGFGLDVGLVA